MDIPKGESFDRADVADMERRGEQLRLGPHRIEAVPHLPEVRLDPVVPAFIVGAEPLSRTATASMTPGRAQGASASASAARPSGRATRPRARPAIRRSPSVPSWTRAQGRLEQGLPERLDARVHQALRLVAAQLDPDSLFGVGKLRQMPRCRIAKPQARIGAADYKQPAAARALGRSRLSGSRSLAP
jgi:hypothetical protein